MTHLQSPSLPMVSCESEAMIGKDMQYIVCVAGPVLPCPAVHTHRQTQAVREQSHPQGGEAGQYSSYLPYQGTDFIKDVFYPFNDGSTIASPREHRAARRFGNELHPAARSSLCREYRTKQVKCHEGDCLRYPCVSELTVQMVGQAHIVGVWGPESL